MAAGLALSKEDLAQVPEGERLQYAIEALDALQAALLPANKDAIKAAQKTLQDAIVYILLQCKPGPPVRKALATCASRIFDITGANVAPLAQLCLDATRTSSTEAHARLGAFAILTQLCLSMGRMMSPFAADILQSCVRLFKAADTATKCAILQCLAAMASKGVAQPKDFHKPCIRAGFGDKAVAVRKATALCAVSVARSTDYIQTTDLENTFHAAVKSLENSHYQHRQAVALFLGALLASTQSAEAQAAPKGGKRYSLDDIMGLLGNAFIKGAGSGDIIKTDLLKSNQAYRTVRVGVTHAYVVLFRELGGSWLEKQIDPVVRNLLDILKNPKIAASPADAVHSVNAIVYIVRNVLGGLLGEQGRINSVKAFCQYVAKAMDSFSEAGQASKDPALDLSCALDCIHELVDLIGSPMLTIVDNVMPVLLSVALHPVKSARLSAARCLRIIGTVVPSRASHIADQCLQRLMKFKSSPDGLHGTAFAFAAVIGGSAGSPLGLPNSLFVHGLSVAEELIQASENQQGSFALRVASVEAGWALLGGLVVLGSAAVGPHVKRVISLWTSLGSSLGSSSSRDMMQWRLVLEGTYGALVTMYGLVMDCKELVTQETQRLIVDFLASTLAMLASLPAAGKASQSLINVKNKLRKHLFLLFASLPVPIYEKTFSALLPHVVADITLNENSNMLATTSLLVPNCPKDGLLLLDDWPQEIDQREIEQQLVVSVGSGLGSIANDSSLLFEPATRAMAPSPPALPADTAVIDAAVTLFGVILPSVSSQKHRLQLFEHFAACIKSSKGARKQAILANVLAALLIAFNGVMQLKGQLGKDKVTAAAKEVIVAALGSQDATVRYAGTEAIARLAQVSGRSFVIDVVQLCSERLKSSRDVVSRTSFALALSTVHRYRSGRDGTSHLESAVAYLHALAQDGSREVQTWSLHALAVLIETSAFDFTPYINATLSLINKTILTTESMNGSILTAAGQALNSLIATIGPELQADTAKRNLVFRTYAQLRGNPDPYVQLGALQGLQQLILFAHRHVHLPTFLPVIKAALTGEHLLLRRTAATALRQLAQREPKETVDHWPGCEELLFKRLDCEDDFPLQSDIKEILITFLMAMARDSPSRWLVLCNNVLSGATERQTEAVEEVAAPEEDGDDDEDGEGGGGATKLRIATTTRTVVPTRWQSKVFAVGCVRKIIEECQEGQPQVLLQNPHFNMALARGQPGHDFLVHKLGELVRTCFIAATSNITELRKVGLEALQDIVACFAASQDPDMGGQHSLLEQYQAQVTAALRPAFSEGTPPDVTAIACKVSAAWMSSGVNRNASDLKRVLNLLEQRLATVKGQPDLAYNERATTQLRLGLLASWASLFVAAAEGGEPMKYLQNLIQEHQTTLRQYWIEALRDFATVILPSEYADQVPDAGVFYGAGTREMVRRYYEQAFPVLIHAVGVVQEGQVDETTDFVLMLGLIVRTLCGRAQASTALSCLKALQKLVPCSDCLRADPALFLELCSVLHYTLRNQNSCKRAVLDVLQAAITGPNRVQDDEPNIAPGSSPVFAVLEVCASTILREIPSLNPHFTPAAGVEPQPLPTDAVPVVASAIAVLSAIPDLCPGKARAQVLPSVLVLLLGVIQQPENALAAPSIKGLKQVVSSCTALEDEASKRACTQVLLSSFQSLLGDLENASTSRKPCLLAAAIYITHLPACLGNEQLQKRVLAVFNALLTSAVPAQRQLGFQVATSVVVQVADASLVAPLIRGVGPHAVRVMSEAVAPGAPVDEARVVAFAEAARFLNAVTNKADEGHRTAALALLMPLLVAALQDSPTQVSFHHTALQTLMKLGPEHPKAFREVVGAAPQLKSRIEAVVRANQASTQQRGASTGAAGTAQATAAPKIQLKMDFSAFKA